MKKLNKPCLVIMRLYVIITICISTIFLSSVSRLMFYQNPHLLAKEDRNTTILLWHAPLWYRKKYQRPEMAPITVRMNKQCGGCIFTTDRAKFELSNTVVFHDSFLERKGDFPDKSARSLAHKYVFWTKENPYRTKYLIHGPLKLDDFDNEFNLTMTYRSDSDIQDMYGCWWNLRPEKMDFTKKTKTAVMIASDCTRLGAKSRIKISDSLMENGLKLDRYGECFGSRFEGNLSTLLRPYKFFLAFENGLWCREYITEKFWSRALGRGLVPVVWGPRKADVERVAPPFSFIHADDFTSSENLSKYINYLDKNDTAYLEYLTWRNLQPPGKVEGVSCPKLEPDARLKDARIPSAFCELCKRVKFQTKISIVSSITKWWYGNESPECLENKLRNILTKIPK
ncbi:4-galactosyl-N-acetylglucosaminide 3-alpha-L-fucosyltransferase FUT6-like [Styela clava]